MFLLTKPLKQNVQSLNTFKRLVACTPVERSHIYPPSPLEGTLALQLQMYSSFPFDFISWTQLCALQLERHSGDTKENNLGWTRHASHLHNIKHIICISLLISLFAAELVPHLQGTFPSFPSCMLSLDLGLIKCVKPKIYFSTQFIMLVMESVHPPNWKLFQYCILLLKHFRHFGFSHPLLRRSPVSSVFENVITYKTHKFTDMRHSDIN